jgi:hypothetical protein
MMQDLYELMHAPKWVQLIMFFGFSLFFVVLLVFVFGFIYYIRQDRYLRRHYFEQWKLQRGTLEDRKRVIIPDDPFLNKLTYETKKIHQWIMIIWFAALVIISLIVALRGAF